MTDNTNLNAGTGGDTVRTIDRSSDSTPIAAKTQVVQLDVGGESNESLVTASNPMPVGLSQVNYQISTANSTTTQLAANATYSGAIEAILNEPSISIDVYSDQPGTLTINQYQDAAGLIPAGQWIYQTAAYGTGFSLSRPTNGNYYQVFFQNTGSATTTKLSISTVNGVIDSADSAGNAPVNIYGSQDLAGIPILEAVIRGDLALTTSPNNLPKTDINNLQMSSDCPAPVRLVSTTVGQTFIIDTLGYPTLSITMGPMAATITGTNDLSGAIWTQVNAILSSSIAVTNALAVNSSYVIPCLFRYIKLTVTTVGWATYYLRNIQSGVQNLSSTPSNILQIGGSSVSVSAGNGSSNKGLGSTQVTAVSNTDQNATAFAGSGRVTGTVVASSQGGGGVISAEINISALTLGTATGVLVILQESTGGTNFTDIWTSDSITSTGIVRCPAIPIAGRRRWCVHSYGGTSTTVTVTITALELSTGSYPLLRQFRDVYSATNSFQTQINSLNQAASSLVLTTASSWTTVFNVEGCNAITAFATFVGGTPTTAPVLTLQFSQDGLNWWNTTATITPTAAGVFAASVNFVAAKYARLIVSTASAGGTAYTLGAVGINAQN